MAEAEAGIKGGAANPSFNEYGSLVALSLLTQQCSEAVVCTFLEAAYACSGLLKEQKGGASSSSMDAAVFATWDALSWEEKQDALRLADMLHAAGVLQHWDGLLAGAARQADWGADRLANYLLLADAFQAQLPQAHAACVQRATQLAAEGYLAVANVIPQLTPPAAMPLLDALTAGDAARALIRERAAKRSGQVRHTQQQPGTAAAAASTAGLHAVAVDMPEPAAAAAATGLSPRLSWARRWRRIQVAGGRLVKRLAESVWELMRTPVGWMLVLAIVLITPVLMPLSPLALPFLFAALMDDDNYSLLCMVWSAWQRTECSHPFLLALLAPILLLVAAACLAVDLVVSLAFCFLVVPYMAKECVARVVEMFDLLDG